MSGEIVGRFAVAGRPRTKGSLTPQISRNGKGQMRVHLVESGEYAVPWKKTMIYAIREQALELDAGIFRAAFEGPVEVRATFFYARTGPAAQGLGRPTLASGANACGDLDKLERNLLDALTQSGLIKDDSLVVKIVSEKRWARPDGFEGVECLVLAAYPDGGPV
jgi:Holliday junction resolvase RusA-like endonuclease